MPKGEVLGSQSATPRGLSLGTGTKPGRILPPKLPGAVLPAVSVP